ncbi:hypothetical protein [Desulfosarcina cetonica]|uniref:hypothetical protein n=1 Tax=Desulfosarcina cetonica TaxID=90730 RepID=UPI0012EE4464|nr:hypothetical protein [Desulfosarcina cetonica]
MIKSFFAWKLTISYLLMFSYIASLIWLLNTISLWKKDHIPVTLLWCVFSAFVMLFDFQKANDQKFFKNSVKDHIKGLVFIEFFVNLYVFNFWIEFVLIPILAFAGGMKAITERDKEYEIVDKLLNYVFILVGSIYIIHSTYMVITDFENFATMGNFESFYIPILLSILFIPFVYMAALVAAYESFFIRLQFFVPVKSVRTYAKLKTFLSIKLNLWKLNKWSVYVISNWRFKNKKEVQDAVVGFKQSQNL